MNLDKIFQNESTIVKGFKYWLSFPSGKEEDNIWRDFPLFNEEVDLINKKEWYEAPHVPSIYSDHEEIIENAGFDGPTETYYEENLDSGDFESKMNTSADLPSDNGELKLNITIDTKYPPSGENNACLVEYFVEASIDYDVPGGVDFLPRFLARPLNRFFKWAYIKILAEEQIEYDGEWAREKVNHYFQHLRKYHGEEPLQAKSRRARFKPAIEDGIFFQ